MTAKLILSQRLNLEALIWGPLSKSLYKASINKDGSSLADWIPEFEAATEPVKHELPDQPEWLLPESFADDIAACPLE